MTNENTIIVSELEAAVLVFVAECQTLINKHLEDREYKWTETLSIEPGRKYIRIVSEKHGARRVYCFIDSTNGDVLKAASWKVPAKHARGNIFAADGGLTHMSAYGPAYLK